MSYKKNLKASKSFAIEESKYEKAFKLIDREQSGTISLLLLDKLLNAANEHINDSEIKSALEFMGKDREEDSLSLEEFKDFIKIVYSPERIIEAFQAFDTDKNGYLDREEFLKVLSDYGGEVSEFEKQAIFTNVDINHDGKIQYKEFVNYWYS